MYDNEVCKVNCFDDLFADREAFMASCGYLLIDSIVQQDERNGI